MSERLPRRRIAVLAAACLPFLPSTPLHAAADRCFLSEPTPASDAQPSGEEKKPKREWKTGKLFVQDAGYVFSAPARWKKKQWAEFGVATAGVVGLAFLDPTIRDAVQRNRGPVVDNFANIIEPFGAEYSFVVIAGFYIGGVSAHDRNARETAVDAIAATLIASGIITPVLKEVVGRGRPYQYNDAYHFRPFSGDASFPSGHTTQAFAVASVIASRYDQPWIKGLSYGIAGSVGFARIVHDHHWASDVAAGALIGASVGTQVVTFNRKARASTTARYSVVPLFEPHGRGAAVVAEF